MKNRFFAIVSMTFILVATLSAQFAQAERSELHVGKHVVTKDNAKDVSATKIDQQEEKGTGEDDGDVGPGKLCYVGDPDDVKKIMEDMKDDAKIDDWSVSKGTITVSWGWKKGEPQFNTTIPVCSK